jgi:RNA 2',3'-cyclic 3'-phosphodiesterase
MARVRTFVALGLPASVRAAIGERIAASRADAPVGLRWGDAGQAHLTLAFLGDLDPAAVESAERCVRAVAAQARPFHAALHGAGAFPDALRARVLWLGWGEGAAAVAALHARLAVALRAAGVPVEARRFTPHVTLARSRSGVDARRALERLADWRSERWRVGSVDLMASTLTAAGARHRLLARAPLGPAADEPM